jgi:hypothetical protein
VFQKLTASRTAGSRASFSGARTTTDGILSNAPQVCAEQTDEKLAIKPLTPHMKSLRFITQFPNFRRNRTRPLERSISNHKHGRRMTCYHAAHVKTAGASPHRPSILSAIK